MMPVIDGFEAMRRIRLTPELANVPIIAMSASATPEVVARCGACGASAFVPKPIEHGRVREAQCERAVVCQDI